MRRRAVLVPLVTAALVGGSGLALAAPPDTQPSSTTLDACGFFTGTQTPAHSSDDGARHTENGQWEGVSNNYGNGPVASLGRVKGAYRETTTTAADGTVSGTEELTSGAGKISQVFRYGPSVPGGYDVQVTATKDLAFLTSDTGGACYSGPFPRP